MPEGLKLIVSADVQQAEKNIKSFVDNTSASFQKLGSGSDFNNLESAFKDLQKQGLISLGSIQSALLELKSVLKQSTDPGEIEKLQKAISFLGNEEKKLKSIGVEKHFEKVSASTTRAKSATLGLSQSFGLLPSHASHVTHAIENILTAFENIRAESGSTSSALKGLFGAIAGSAGLGLAVAGISLLIENLFGLGEATKKVTHEESEFEKQQKKLKEEFDNAAKAVVSQAAQFQDLKIVLTDVSNKYLELTDSVIKHGIAELLFSRKSALVEKLLSDEIENQLKLLKQRQEIKEFKTPTTQALKPLRLGTDAELKKAGLFLSDSEKKISDINKLMQNLGLNFSSFVKDLKDPKTKPEIEFIPKFDLKKLDDLLKKESGFNKISLNIQGEVIPEVHIKKKDADKLFDELKKQVSSKALIQPVEIPAKVVFDAKLLEAQMNDLNKILAQGFADIFAGIGETIATGDITNVTKVLGSVIQQIGKALIQYGIVKTGLDKILTGGVKIPGAVAIGLGIAAVAIGQLIKNAKPQGFKEGGFTGFGSPNEIAGVVHRGEFVIPADIVKQMRNNSQPNLSGLLGGSSQIVVLKTIISGSDLALVSERTSRSQKRLSAA